MLQNTGGSQPGCIDIRILVNRDRVRAPGFRGYQMKPAGLHSLKRLLRVSRFDAMAIRHNPDLQEVDRIHRGAIELTVKDTGAGAYALNVTGFHQRVVSLAVPVFQDS